MTRPTLSTSRQGPRSRLHASNGDEGGAPPDYLQRNRAAWNIWASTSRAEARKVWEAPEMSWGIWATPESDLNLFGLLEPGSDIVELGSGTASVSAWAQRSGLFPVAVDFCSAQIDVAEQCQRDFGASFPLVLANAEEVPYDHSSFDAAISEYGVSVWCNPRRWLPEAHRLLRPNGQLVFFTNGAMLISCTPLKGGKAGTELVRDYFGSYRVEFADSDTVEFHPTHGQWIRLLRASGFAVEHLIELRPSGDTKPRYDFVSADWARRWPSEEVWVARKVSPHLSLADADDTSPSVASQVPPD